MRLRRGADHLVTAFLTAGVLSLVVPGFDQPWVSVTWHRPFVGALFVAGGLAVWATWARLRWDGGSRAAMLFAAFAALGGIYFPHVLLEATGPDPAHLVFGPASRLAFGVLLVAAVGGVELPRRLREPRVLLAVVAVVIVATDAVLHSAWFRAALLSDPLPILRGLEGAAAAAQVTALITMAVRRRGEWSPFGTALSRATVVMIGASLLFLSTAPWTLRWWLAHLGLLVAAALISSAILLERGRRGSLAATVELDAASSLADALLDEYPSGVAGIADDGTLLAWNAAARTITGWDEGEARTRMDELVEGRRVLGRAIVEIRTVAVHRLGRTVRVVFLQDVSDHVELERENHRLDELTAALEVALSEKDELLGVVAHELRNPLGVVRGFAITLGLRMADRVDETEALLLERTEASAVRMLQLVDDLLSYAQHGGEGLVPRLVRKDVDVSELVAATLEVYSAAAEQKQIEFVADLASPCRAYVDGSKIEQVVDNLISNALKYSPRGASVHVSTEVRADVVAVVVADTGQGIPEDEQGMLFQPFGTASSQPTDGEVSTGLGLAIADRLVRAHGGVIDVLSAPGKGATFSMLLPRDGVGERTDEIGVAEGGGSISSDPRAG